MVINIKLVPQFRQSIKRIFGIHTKKRGSKTEKCYNNTIVSPAHRQSAYNDITVRYNSSDTLASSTPKKHKERFTTTTEDSDNHSISLCINDVNRTSKACELCTIQENKTVSDAERSGDTVCDEESCTSNKKNELVFGESCNILKEPSPILTIVNSEKLIFNRPQIVAQQTIKNINSSVAENTNEVAKTQAEFDKSLNIIVQKTPIKHSFSLDLGKVTNESKKRKFSIETKLDTFNPPRIFSKDRVVSKLFDSESKQRHDSVKSYLCENYKCDSDNVNL